jgi:hypothetical protein
MTDHITAAELRSIYAKCASLGYSARAHPCWRAAAALDEKDERLAYASAVNRAQAEVRERLEARIEKLEEALSPRPSYCPGAGAARFCELIVVPCRCAALRTRLDAEDGTP